MVGRLHYPATNQYGCDKFTKENFINDYLFDEDDDMTPIVMVDIGGECSLTQKVRNIEQLGVKMAVIAANVDETSLQDYSMDDDGSGHSLTIPAFLISRPSAVSIKHALQVGEKVVIKGILEIVHPINDFVEYELWYTSIFDLEPNFIFQLYEWHKVVKDRARFTPRILTMRCTVCPDEIKEKMCIHNGEYCLIQPRSFS